MTLLSIEQTASALGLNLSAAQVASLHAYLDLLVLWNGSFNLTAVRDRDAMLVQHVFDCLAVIPALARHRPEGGRLLDVGSGGGLPGVVIAICAPAWRVDCVDAVGKKAAFVRQVAAELALPNLRSIHGRMPAASVGLATADVIVSRAFASLADFISWTRPSLKPDGVWLAMKGKVPDDEIAGLPADIDVFHVEPVAVPGLDAQRCFVWMRQKAEPTPAAR